MKIGGARGAQAPTSFGDLPAKPALGRNAPVLGTRRSAAQKAGTGGTAGAIWRPHWRNRRVFPAMGFGSPKPWPNFLLPPSSFLLFLPLLPTTRSLLPSKGGGSRGGFSPAHLEVERAWERHDVEERSPKDGGACAPRTPRILLGSDGPWDHPRVIAKGLSTGTAAVSLRRNENRRGFGGGSPTSFGDLPAKTAPWKARVVGKHAPRCDQKAGKKRAR